MRGTAWMNVFSPRTESFDLVGTSRNCRMAGLRPMPVPGWPGWDCRRRLGGMNPRAGGLSSWNEQFRYCARLERPAGRADPGVVDVRASLPGGSAPLRPVRRPIWSKPINCSSGTITNTLPLPLGRVHSGSRPDRCTNSARWSRAESARLGPMAKRSDLKTLLTGRRTVRDAGRQVPPGGHALRPVEHGHSVYPADDDVLRGGRRTPLHRPVERLPELRRSERFAQGRSGNPGCTRSNCRKTKVIHGAQLLRDGKPLGGAGDRHVTIYRFVFPVTRGERREEREQRKAERSVTLPRSSSARPSPSPLSSLP